MDFIKNITKEIFKSNDRKNLKTNRKEKRSNELILIKDFCACVNGEMNLTCGQKALFLYQEDDWFFVESMRGIRGFVPKSHFRGQVHEGVTRLSNYSETHCNNDIFDDEYEDEDEVFEINTQIVNRMRNKRANSIDSYSCETLSGYSSYASSHLDEQDRREFDFGKEMSILEQLINTRRLLQDDSLIEYFV